MSSLGLTDLVSKFTAGSVTHDLSNVLTLWIDIHQSFDELGFWLEPTDTPHEVHLFKLNLSFAIGIDQRLVKYMPRARHPGFVIYKSLLDRPVCCEAESNPRDEPFLLPDPRLLAIHAARAQTAHLSGAINYPSHAEK